MLQFLRDWRLKYRQAKRAGAFSRAKKKGMSNADARTYSDALYPPTVEDIAYEEKCRRTLNQNEQARSQNAPYEKWTVSPVELAQGFHGRQFGELVLYHVKRGSLSQSTKAILDTNSFLPKELQQVSQEWIDINNQYALNEKFWQTDCGDPQPMQIISAQAKASRTSHWCWAFLCCTCCSLFSLFSNGFQDLPATPRNMNAT
jgi:hypothetical protein